MKKSFFAILVFIVALMCIVTTNVAYAANATNTADSTIKETIGSTIENVGETIEETIGSIGETIEGVIDENIKDENASNGTEQYKAPVTLTLVGAKHSSSITVTISGNANQTLTFSKDNNWTLSTQLPIGEYKITDYKTDNRMYSLKVNEKSFVVNDMTGNAVRLNAAEEERSFTLKNLLKNNMFLLMFMAGAFIALYIIKKRNKKVY